MWWWWKGSPAIFSLCPGLISVEGPPAEPLLSFSLTDLWPSEEGGQDYTTFWNWEFSLCSTWEKASFYSFTSCWYSLSLLPLPCLAWLQPP